MEIVPSNSENDDRLRRLNICKRKRTTFYKSKPSSSSSANNKVISLRNSRSSNTKAAAGGNFSEAPPRAMGIDGSVPEGDWFCHNCSKEADGSLSDSTVNVTSEASSSKRRRRSMKRACKVSSGCCLCSKIQKKIIPDENDFFSFRTKSKAQSNLSDRRGQPSATNNDDDDDGGVGSAIIQRNTNNNVDKRLVLRPRKRAEGNNYQIQTRKTAAKRASSSSAQAAEKEQNSANNQPPRRRGRPRKYPQQNDQAPPPPPQQQQQKKEKPGRAMVVYGANLPAEYLEAMRVAEEARRNNAKEIPWAGVELDALWVGVRRHGADNWDTILGDPNLCILVLCKKTSLDLSLRWKKELEKMSSILQASGYLLSPPPPPPPPTADREQPVDDRPAISNVEAATSPQILPPQVTWTESGPSLPHRQGSSSSSASVPPPPPRTEGEAAAQPVLPEPPQFPDGGTETGLVVPNNNQGSPSSCPMKSTEIGEGNSEEQLLTPQCGALVVPPNEHKATSSPAIPVETSTGEQHVGVTSSESGGALVGPHGYYQQGASSSRSIPRASDVTVAVAPPTWRQNLRLRPPPWRPNLNLNPMANHVMFEAFQRRRANPAPPQTMMNHMAALPAPRPPPNTTTASPSLYLGGFFPVRNPY
ncbi:hypothetical protein K1719_012563 [Acacia pycnantha]|nr:hypothetical protein K1719_012563 [Acacia pycnantha]